MLKRQLPVLKYLKNNFFPPTEPSVDLDTLITNPYINNNNGNGNGIAASTGPVSDTSEKVSSTSSSGFESMGSSITSSAPVIITPEQTAAPPAPPPAPPTPQVSIEEVIKSLIHFVASRKTQSLWSYEDITAKVWSI